MRILVTSDLHLSDRIWKHRPIEGDSYDAWRAIVEYATTPATPRIDAIIIAGDILDRQTNQARAIHHLTAGLSTLIANDIRVFFNQGQHCMQENPWPRLVDGVVHLKLGDVYDLGGLKMTGFDYCSEEQLQENLKHESVKNADILVCHQVWKDFMGDVGKPQGCFADVPDNVSFIFTGDYHEAICQGYAGKIVVSPGSTHLRSISEPVDKSFWVCDTEKKEHMFKSVEIPTRRCFHHDISSHGFPLAVILDGKIEASLDANQAYWDAILSEGVDVCTLVPLIRITHEPDQLDDNCKKVINKYKDKAHFFYKMVRPEAENQLEVLEYVDVSDRLKMIDCLDTAVDQKEQPKVHSLATALLSGGEPGETLKKWIKEQVDEGS